MARDLGGWEYTSCPYWDVRTTVPDWVKGKRYVISSFRQSKTKQTPLETLSYIPGVSSELGVSC